MVTPERAIVIYQPAEGIHRSLLSEEDLQEMPELREPAQRPSR